MRQLNWLEIDLVGSPVSKEGLWKTLKLVMEHLWDYDEALHKK